MDLTIELEAQESAFVYLKIWTHCDRGEDPLPLVLGGSHHRDPELVVLAKAAKDLPREVHGEHHLEQGPEHCGWSRHVTANLLLIVLTTVLTE